MYNNFSPFIIFSHREKWSWKCYQLKGAIIIGGISFTRNLQIGIVGVWLSREMWIIRTAPHNLCPRREVSRAVCLWDFYPWPCTWKCSSVFHRNRHPFSLHDSGLPGWKQRQLFSIYSETLIQNYHKNTLPTYEILFGRKSTRFLDNSLVSQRVRSVGDISLKISPIEYQVVFQFSMCPDSRFWLFSREDPAFAWISSQKHLKQKNDFWKISYLYLFLIFSSRLQGRKKSISIIPHKFFEQRIRKMEKYDRTTYTWWSSTISKNLPSDMK